MVVGDAGALQIQVVLHERFYYFHQNRRLAERSKQKSPHNKCAKRAIVLLNFSVHARFPDHEEPKVQVL